MIQAFRIIEISKYDDGGQLTTRGQLMQGSSTALPPIMVRVPIMVTPRRGYLGSTLLACRAVALLLIELEICIKHK